MEKPEPREPGEPCPQWDQCITGRIAVRKTASKVLHLKLIMETSGTQTEGHTAAQWPVSFMNASVTGSGKHRRARLGRAYSFTAPFVVRYQWDNRQNGNRVWGLGGRNVSIRF